MITNYTEIVPDFAMGNDEFRKIVIGSMFCNGWMPLLLSKMPEHDTF